jgi:hypothetical protein
MREPIIVEADDGFHFIAMLSFAEMSLEAIDITNGEYTVYDADGFKLDLGPAASGGGVISSPEFLVNCRSELEPKLRQFFVRLGIPSSELSTAAFSDLIQVGVDRFIEQPPQIRSSHFWAAIRGLFRRRSTT